MPGTSDGWVEAVIGFNSLDYDKVKISFGAPEGESGEFWVDDLYLEEVGLINVLRRSGTPLSVRGEQNGTLYEEGRDFAPVADPELNFLFDHDGPQIKLPPNSRIKPGERLRVSYYHVFTVFHSQVTLCMSEPELYKFYRTQVQQFHDILQPGTYFLNLDEIRAGGTCAACKARNMTIAQIYGDFITKGTAIIRQANPQAEIVIWSDMLDPNQNADSLKWNTYYHVSESYHGSWNYIPKDLIIACWYNKIRRKSLDHFSGLGFRTIAAAYYDADDLENPKGWLEELDRTPGAQGIIYTSWRNKYELLGPFGDLVSGWKRGK